MRTPTIFVSGQRLILALAYLLTGCAFLFAQDTTTASTASITVKQPQFNNTYSGTVSADIQVTLPFDPATFQAELNGTDVTKLFSLVCVSASACDEQAQFPESEMLNGTNILVADVGGPNESVATARVKFEFNGSSASNAPVEKMIAGVAVQAVNLPKGADPNNPNSYQILLGPGPDFPQQVFTAQNLGCSAGINSMQVLVLGRQTLQPESRIGSGTGQACFGDAASLATFLGTIPKGDLVIANSFLGLMPTLNTTAIGGTDYTKTNVATWYYNVIGVAGAPAGSAYESYQPIHPIGPDYLAPLKGSLMLDIHQNYFFSPSDYTEFKVIPPDASNPNTSTMIINGTTYTNSLPAGAQGGFRVLLLDRRMGYIQGDYVYPTNSTDANQSAQAIANLNNILTTASPDYLIVASTIGTAFSSTAQAGPLHTAITALGGNPFMLGKLIPRQTGDSAVYTLVSSTDPDYVKAGNAVENCSLWNAQGETGEVHGVFARDHKNRYYVKSALTDIPQVGGVSSGISWAWEQVAFQQPQDWPQWTPGQQAAYNDLTSSSNNYPVITSRLGCGNGCQPIRAYYDGGVGGTGAANLNVLKINWETLAYKANPNYTQEDFQAVVNQLAIEQGYLNNVYAVYDLFRALTYEANDNLASELSQVASRIDSSLNAGLYDPSIAVGRLEKAAAVTQILSVIPYVGPAFGAASTVLGGVAQLVPPAASTVPDGSYAVKLSELIAKNQTFATNLANTTDVLFSGFTTDWGKLQTIGAGYGQQQAPWYMCQSCSNAQPPRAALPAIALGAKRQFYSQLMGLTYSLDLYGRIQYSNPQQVGSEYYQNNGPLIAPTLMCKKFYANANPNAWLVYTNFDDPSKYDLFIVTRTTKDKPFGSIFPTLYFPSTDLSTDLFGAPTVTNGFLSGGAGFVPDEFMYSPELTPTPPWPLTRRPGETTGQGPWCSF